MPFKISIADIADIYAQMFAGLFQQSFEGEFDEKWHSFPRDPNYVARGVSAAFGIRFRIVYCDFFEGLSDIEEHLRDLFCFHEHGKDRSITIYVNSNLTRVNRPLLSRETQRFAVLKEIFIAALRRHYRYPRDEAPARPFPDTIDLIAFNASLMDWLIEKPSIFDLGGHDDSPVPSVENAAEILALISLANLPEIHGLRAGLKEIDGKDAKGVEDEFWSVFSYSEFAAKYGLHHRHTLVLFRTDFVDRFFTAVLPLLGDNALAFSNTGNDAKTFSTYIESVRPILIEVYADLVYRLEKALQEGSMDIVTFLGIAGSLASIISFLRGNKVEITPEAIKNELDKRSRQQGTPEYELRTGTGNGNFSKFADQVIDVYSIAPDFLDRIENRCLKTFKEMIQDHSQGETELYQAREQAKKCVCLNIRLAMELNNRSFPSPAFRSLWERFDCGM